MTTILGDPLLGADGPREEVPAAAFRPDLARPTPAGRAAATVVVLGKWGPPLLTFARRCATVGTAYLLDVGDRPRDSRRYSSSLAGGAWLDPRLLGTDEGLARVRAYVRQVGAQALIALTDTHLFWLARHADRLAADCKLLIPTLESLELLAGKKSQIELARQTGFDVLPTWYLTRPEDLAAVPESAYPLALRPDQPYTKREWKVARVRSAAELRQFLIDLQELEHLVIAQPLRHWPNLLVHGVRAESGELLALEAFLVYRKFEGVALSLKRTPLPPSVAQSCAVFAAAAGLVGCFHFDLLYDPDQGRAYYLEVNTRMGGTTDKVGRLGFDEPLLTLAAFGFPVAPSVPPPRDGAAVANRRALLKHIGWALRGRLSDLDYPAGSRWAHVRQSCRELWAARDSVFDWRDLRGSLWFYLRI